MPTPEKSHVVDREHLIAECQNEMMRQRFHALLLPVVVVLVGLVLLVHSRTLQGLLYYFGLDTGRPVVNGIILSAATLFIGYPVTWYFLYRHEWLKYKVRLTQLQAEQVDFGQQNKNDHQ